jgi:PAS domain S-box-containing protein
MHILRYWKYVFFIVLFLGLNIVLLYLAYDNIKREMIDNLNARQMIHAKQAAIGIETFFRTDIESLKQLAKNEHIINLDNRGMELMQEFFTSHEEISIISRIDNDGRILYAIPFDQKAIHQPVTSMQDFLQVRRTHQVVVSDVFLNRRGFKSIIVHVPVIRNGSFDGTFSILFRISSVISRYVQDIKIGQDGYAWVISQSGIEISCPIPGHVGNSVFTNCKDFPDIIAMAKRMIRGESGVTTYHFDRIRGKAVTTVKKHAVFMPINLGSTMWSIVVATPEDEVIGALDAFRNKLILIALLLITGIVGLIYLLFRNSLLVEEIERRKKAEEKIRLQALVLDQIEDRVTITDLSGNITYVNEAEAASLGHSCEELIGRSIEVYGDDPKKGATQKEIIKETLEHGSWRGEVVNYAKDGREIIMDCRTVLVRDTDGIPIAMAGVGTDITRRKQTEAALRKSEQALLSIFKATPVGLTIMKNRVFQSFNKAYCDIVGYSEADLIGQPPRVLYEDEVEYERVGRALDSGLNKSGIAIVQTKHRRKNGVIRDVVLTSVLLQSKTSALKTVVAIEDITDRIQTEKALRDNRKHLADIIDFLPDATLVIDKNGRVITWNRTIEALTGIKKENIIGKGNYEYAIPFYGYRRPVLIDYALHPNKEMETQYTAIQRTGDMLFGEAFTPNLPPGDIHLSGTASVLRDDNGEIIGAIECIRDNTERKRLEERLQRAEKMEALGTLAGGVAHDLNNVLGIMVGYSELLLEKLPEDSQQKKYAGHILQSSVKGAAIIQDLLTLARRGVTVSEIVNLNDIILSYFRSPEFERLRSDHPSVKISTDLEKGLLNLKGSSLHLGKTLMNLISNAFESIEGPGEVVIRTENRYLDRPIRSYDEMREGDYLVLTVSDSGSGISANDLGKIFEPFYTKKVMGRSGTGLGLAVVWGTVKDHHGYIDVQSEEGRGSTFTLYFPVTREEPAKIDKGASPDTYKGKGESILVVDDVKEQRELATSMLAWLGYHVESVNGGEEAIEYLRHKKADLVVLDMIMDPGIDGLGTYEKILEIAPGQKAVIVSGFSETDRVRKAQEMGAGTFVRKPYILEKIGCAVRQELDRK